LAISAREFTQEVIMEIITPEVIAHYAKFGHLCFAFTNTVAWRARNESTELLPNYSRLVRWSCIVQLIAEDEAKRLLDLAALHLAQAETALERAIHLRELIYRIFLAVARGEAVAATDLDLFNGELSEVMSRACIERAETGYTLGWAGTDNALDWILWPVVRAASDLLTSSDLDRIGVCEGEGCGWLFFDHSRNRSRRWCDMGDCGNRAKARRSYNRRR
jgi:predicted RNA-binding Zn ribbon-like protein